MSISRLDQFYRSLVLSKFFPKGWGNNEHFTKLLELRKLVSDRDKCQHLVEEDYDIDIHNIEDVGDCHLVNGKFISPLAKIVPGILPPAAETAHFQFVLPNNWKSTEKPLCIHMAGTGDHYFWRRRYLIAKPLLKEHGIASLILENPFYGHRKPSQQYRSSLNHVYDLYLMGAGLILESLAILRWCVKHGYGPMVLHGISMGGHMASLACSAWPKPIALVPCLSWSTASSVFTEGVMSDAINWKGLEELFASDEFYRKELEKFINNDPHGLYGNGVENSRHLPKKKKSKTNPSLNSFNLLSNKLLTNQEKSDGVAFSVQKQEHLKASATISSETDEKTKFAARKETLHFMRCIMDEFTHLKNYPVPVDTELIIAVAARKDGYVPRNSIASLEEVWPGCEIRYVDSGHVSAYIWYQGAFRKAIVDALNKYNDKYHIDGTPKHNTPSEGSSTSCSKRIQTSDIVDSIKENSTKENGKLYSDKKDNIVASNS